MWTFIQDQILGMKWLNALIEQLLLMVGLNNVDSRIGGSIQFFIYDTIKITVLLCALIFLISYIQSFFPPERSRKTRWAAMFVARFFPAQRDLIGGLRIQRELVMKLLSRQFGKSIGKL